MTPTSGENRKKQKPDRGSGLITKPGKGTCFVSVDRQKGVSDYIALVADDSVTMKMVGDVIEIDVNGVKIFMKACRHRSMQIDGLPSVKEFCVSMFTFNNAGSSPLTNSEKMVTQ